MANTRDFKSLGVWAEDAVTPVPGFPTPGTAYREDTLTESQNKEGELFETKPDSAQFNQKMYIITSFLDLIDKHGTVGWTDLVDYVVPAIVWGSDANFYFALQASGPSSTVKDPVSEPAYWEVITSATKLRQDLADETPGTEGSRLVGYNKFDTNGGIDDGLTVKEALDEIYNVTRGLGNLRLVLSGNFDGVTGLSTGSTFNVYQNKAFLTVNPTNPQVTGYTVFSDDLNARSFQNSLVFVSVHSEQDPALPAGNFIPSVLAVDPNVFSVPPLFTESRQGVSVFEYAITTGISETQSLNFDVLVVTVEPFSFDASP